MGRLVLASFSLLGSDHSQAADFRAANPLTLGGRRGGDGTASPSFS